MGKTKKSSSTISKSRKSKPSSPTHEFNDILRPSTRLKPSTTVLTEFKSHVSKTTTDILSIYTTAQTQMKSTDEDFCADLNHWLIAYQELSHLTVETQKSQFTQMQVATEGMLSKIEKHTAFVQGLASHHTSVLAHHDLESGKVMDETSHLLNVYKGKYHAEIERRNRHVTMQDVTNVPIEGTPRNVKYVNGLGKLLVLLDAESEKKERQE